VTTYTFTLVLGGVEPLSDEKLDALADAGCDDAAFGERDSVFYGDFDREASSLAEAVGTAIRAVEGAVPGLRVLRVDLEDEDAPSEPFVAALNGALEVRRRAPELAAGDERSEIARLIAEDAELLEAST
jgi:hypothetical protein